MSTATAPRRKGTFFPPTDATNLDALMDCLRDVADRHDGPWTLVWRPSHGGADPGVLDVLGDLDDEYPDLSIVVADR